MSNTLQERINKRFVLLREMAEDVSWKDPWSPGYDRQVAENALYYTVGPLTESPRWAQDWASPSGYTYRTGQPAPQWTQDEITIAMAGDPKFLYKNAYSPRSPLYGDRGGAPVWRLAKRIARHYKRPELAYDLYSLGVIELTRRMQPGYDEGRGGFISYVMPAIEGAMINGVGGTTAARSALGDRAQNVTGLEGLLQAKSGEQARQYASQVRGKYQTARSHDKNPDNPFAPYSADYFRLANQYADALDSGDPEQVERVQNQIRQLQDSIRDETQLIPGAATGAGQAISDPTRKTPMGITSIDVPTQGTEGAKGTMASQLPQAASSSTVDPEAIKYILDLAINYDLAKVLGKKSRHLQNLDVDISGPMGANELRYALRYLGEIAQDYPGRGRVRANTNIPRDAKGWWRPGEDPELEPIPGSKEVWESIWVRDGFPTMGPTTIAEEMTKEFLEFQKLGIASARKLQQKAKGAEVISKVAVSNTFKMAVTKLKLAADLSKGQLGLDESTRQQLRSRGVLLAEDLDAVDAGILMRAANYIIAVHNRFVTECVVNGW